MPKFFALLLGLVIPVGGMAEEWNRFRGPNGSGLAAEGNIPSHWTANDYVHQIKLPGNGNSSPVIWKDKLFVTAAEEASRQRHLVCYHTLTGKKLWQESWPFEKEKKHAKNTFASNTPACDAERVYTLWQAQANSQLVACDHAGKRLWQIELGPYESNHGCGLSPIVVGNIVVVNNNQEGKDSYLLGVEAATGKEVWRVSRKPVKATYSTPTVFRNAIGEDELIFTSWHYGFTSVNPLTGKVNWELDTFEKEHEKRSVGSPIVAGGMVLGNCGFAGGKKYLVALKPNGKSATEVYRLDRNVNHQTTAIAVKDLLFLWNDQGVVVCCKLATGEILWEKRVGGNYAGSPIAIGGLLYAMSQNGEVVVLKAAAEFEEVGRVKLPEGSSATPAVGSGLLWLRVEDQLLAVGKPAA